MRNLLICILLIMCDTLTAQSFNADKVAFTNFLVRMYHTAPFEGVRIVKDDDEKKYLLSVLSIETKNKSERIINRLASVKSMTQVSRFLNGSEVTDSTIICTTKNNREESNTEIIEIIREKSIGYIKSLELLTCLKDKVGNKVFFFLKQIE